MDLNGKVAVVTGAARGLGFAICQALSRRGAKVVLAARTLDEATRVAATIDAAVLPAGCDVRARGEVDALLARAVGHFGQVDLWVNNAGPAGAWGPARAVRPEDSLPAIESTVLGTYLGTLAALGHMAKRGTGQIVNLLGRGERGQKPQNAAWDASKAWVRSFTLAVAAEQAGSGVGVIAFEPGLMESRMALMPEVVAGVEPEFKARLKVMRLLSVPPELPAERLVRALERDQRGEVWGVPELWPLFGPLRMVFGGRPDFVISPKVLPPRQ